MFHAQHGLFFQRLPGGDVRIVKTRDGKEPVDDSIVGNITMDETLTQSSFASVVSSMSASGEANGGWYLAMELLKS